MKSLKVEGFSKLRKLGTLSRKTCFVRFPGSETGGVERLWAPVRFGLLTASQLAAACQLTSVWASGPLADRLRLLLHQRSDDPPQVLLRPHLHIQSNLTYPNLA